MRIFVDAMGGDLAPQASVEGTVEALRRNPELTVTLAGIVPEIEKYLAGADDVRSRITLLDAPEVITNHESPVMGVRKKTKSATVLGMLAVRDKEADGFVSAGSTGAVLAGGMFRLGRIPGVERPALAPLMPNGKGYFLLIDSGANVDCKPEYLRQFAIMGDIYMRRVQGMKEPRVGLLNIGAESEKGNQLTKETYPLLENAPLHFVGNVEGRDVTNDPKIHGRHGRDAAGHHQKRAAQRFPRQAGRADRQARLQARKETDGLYRGGRRAAAGRKGRGGQGARLLQRPCHRLRHPPGRRHGALGRGANHRGNVKNHAAGG